MVTSPNTIRSSNLYYVLTTSSLTVWYYRSPRKWNWGVWYGCSWWDRGKFSAWFSL